MQGEHITPASTERIFRRLNAATAEAGTILAWVREGKRFIQTDSLWWIIETAGASSEHAARGSDV